MKRESHLGQILLTQARSSGLLSAQFDDVHTHRIVSFGDCNGLVTNTPHLVPNVTVEGTGREIGPCYRWELSLNRDERLGLHAAVERDERVHVHHRLSGDADLIGHELTPV